MKKGERSKLFHTGYSAQETTVRMELLKRQRNFRWLARESGMAVETLRNQMARGFPQRTSRIRVEAALGIPVWSTPAQFRRRAALSLLFGYAPELAPIRKLWGLAKGLGVTGYREMPKSRLIDELAARLSVNKSPRPAKD